jgi:hypothetical protein
LHNVDDRQVEVREDIDLHPHQREAARDEESGEEHHDRDGVPHGEDGRVHQPLW